MDTPDVNRCGKTLFQIAPRHALSMTHFATFMKYSISYQRFVYKFECA